MKDTNKTVEMDPIVAKEVLQDMFFIVTLFHIQDSIDDKWLRDYYTKIIISYLAIVLHECLQADLLDKKRSDNKAKKILRDIRHRIVKLNPSENSKSIKEIMSIMGIDFGHYCFDLQISLNQNNNNELFDIGFTYYSIIKDAEDFDILNALMRIPFEIVDGIVSTSSMEKYKKELLIYNERLYMTMGKYVSERICIHKYPYASGVFFKQHNICQEDKLVILYYYTLIKQAVIIDILVPDHVCRDIIIFDTLSAKCKYRAIIIENIGQYLKRARTPLAEEITTAIKDSIDSSFFSINRSIKNNIHYKKTTVYEKKDMIKLYSQQGVYLNLILDIFQSKIKYSVGLKYKMIRLIADKTDETMIEIRKKHKNLKRIEDVSMDEWEKAKERLRKKNR